MVASLDPLLNGSPPGELADAVADCDDNGVDLTLVRYTLSLTPTERLKAVENFMNVMSTVRTPARLSQKT